MQIGSRGNRKQVHLIVTSGLTGSETVVNNPPQKLKDGDMVKVKS